METLKKIGEYWSTPGAWFFNVYILLGTLGLLIFTFIFVNAIYPAMKQKREKSGLFKRLGDLCQLNAHEARILYRIASASRMEEPAMIFVKRSAFENIAHTLEPHLSDAIRRKVYL